VAWKSEILIIYNSSCGGRSHKLALKVQSTGTAIVNLSQPTLSAPQVCAEFTVVGVGHCSAARR